MQASARVKKLRESMLTTPAICVERGHLFTKSYRETEGEPEVIRRAKAVRQVLAGLPVFIEEGELIVGRGASKQRAGILTPELNAAWYLEEMDLFSTRAWDRFLPLSEEEKERIREFVPYWKGKSLRDKWCARVPQELQDFRTAVQLGGAFCGNNQYYGHNGIDYQRILSKGINGLQAEVGAAQAKLNLADLDDLEKSYFLKAVAITLEAAKSFALRYASLAATLAEEEVDQTRKSELKEIAATCAAVPAGPARTFREALQSIWFAYLVLMVESPGTGAGFLRVDQYLYPFYRQDLEQGHITREEAAELIALLYIKCNGLVIPYPTPVAMIFAGLTLGANFVLGGVTREGQDAVNELSYLFLEVEEEVGLNSEDLIIRVNKKTPDGFVVRACEVAKRLRGKLKFVSDETIVLQLLQDGKPYPDVLDYAVTGCNSPTVPGLSLDIPGGMTNIPLMLELALNDGVSRMSGEQIGPRTGDPRMFTSFDEVWDAFRLQVEALIPVALLYKNVDKQLFAQFAQSPFQSALYRGCIERGRDVIDGGTAPYLSHAISLSGLPNVGDSLAAIRKVVFEDRKGTMAELVAALDRDFERAEGLLNLLKAAPKFGNDDDYVDDLVNRVLTLGSDEAAKTRGFAGAVSNVAAGSITASIPLGAAVGALPDGRKAGQPLAEGGISPYQGRNVSGPTATMMSVAKLNHMKMTNGSVLNMRFNPDALKDDGKIRKFAALIRTYLENGGFFVQFNVVTAATLKEAQLYPERYKDLLVRVSTYSAYFVELSRPLQDDIIARIEFQEV